MHWKWWLPAAWLAIVCICFAAPAHAQTATSATVTGIFSDASGLVVPGTTIEIRNHATNQVSQAVTDSAGRFRILYLPVGDYHLSAQLSGFTTANVNLRLAVGDQIDVPIVLQPAGVAFADTVVGDAPLVEARRTELASVIR